MFIVLVSDIDIKDSSEWHPTDTPEVIGPFPTQQAAEEWSWSEGRYLAAVLPVTFREPSS